MRAGPLSGRALLLAALCIAATSGRSLADAATTMVADTGHLSVASDGSPPPAVKPTARFLASWPGRTAGAADAEAERPGGLDSAAAFSALLRLPQPVGLDGAETIIGDDERQRVDPTTTFPARATVLITFSGGRCSGWLIGPDLVVTAGHCVHPGPLGQHFYRDVVVYPGRNGSASPYGSCTARRLYASQGWIDTGDDRFDYGAVKLNCRIGNTTGWFGLYHTPDTLTGATTIITGYPGDKPLTQWRTTDRVRLSLMRRLFYRNDTIGGMSGSPVYSKRPGCGVCAVAVHAYGTYGDPPSSRNNHGTRITQKVFDNLVAWRDAP